MDSFQERTEDGTALETAGEIPEGPLAEQGDQPLPSGAEMGELPVEDWDYQRPKRGEIRRGVILSIEPQQIIIDVDAKRDGIVPYADIQRMGEQAIAELEEGQEVDVYILQPEDQDGNLLVSLFQARQSVAWKQAKELADSGEIWEGEVVGYNKGGLVVPLGEIRGFVPASQVPGFPRGLSQEERLQRLSGLVGERLKVKVIEIDRRSRRLILSAAAAQREWRSAQRRRLLSELREGEVRKGRVSSLCSFGAFVDLGGADGLVHLSELSWRRVRHARDVVKVGQEVEVIVLRLDEERKRIGLSLKRLQPEPWALVEDKYELGQLVEGVVTNVVDFGAFAEIEAGVEGLIHVSELTEQTITHPRDVVKKGDLLLLRIIRIDVRRRRLGLSLKRVLESEWAGWAARVAAQRAEAAAEAEEEAALAEAEEEALAAEVEGEAVVAEAEEEALAAEVEEEAVPAEAEEEAAAEAEEEALAAEVEEEAVPAEAEEEAETAEAEEEVAAEAEGEVAAEAEEEAAVDEAEAEAVAAEVEDEAVVAVAEEEAAVAEAEEEAVIPEAEEEAAVAVAEEEAVVTEADEEAALAAADEETPVDEAEEEAAVDEGSAADALQPSLLEGSGEPDLGPEATMAGDQPGEAAELESADLPVSEEPEGLAPTRETEADASPDTERVVAEPELETVST